MATLEDPPPRYADSGDVRLHEKGASASYRSPDKVIVKTETNQKLNQKLKCYKICVAILAILVIALLVAVAVLAWRVVAADEIEEGSTAKDSPAIGSPAIGGRHSDDDLPLYDCTDVLVSGRIYSSVYSVFIADKTVRPSRDKVAVYCDMTTEGGAWTVLMRRQMGHPWQMMPEVNFDQPWSRYKAGFGRPDDEFWMGNDLMYQLTNNGYKYELRVDMMNFDDESRYAVYDSFKVGPETDNYVLSLGVYSGNAGDSLTKHNGAKFSTKDRDNDEKDSSCSANGGGWWYTDCFSAKLTGSYGAELSWSGIVWRGFGDDANLKYVEMKIRRIV